MKKILFLGMMLLGTASLSAKEVKYDTLYVCTEAIIKIKLDTIFNVRCTKDTIIKYFKNKIKIDKKFDSDDPVMLCITTPTPYNIIVRTKRDYLIENK